MRRFSLLVIFRVLLLVATTMTFAFIFGDERLIFNHIILGAVIIFQVWEMIHFVGRTNSELTRLFNAVRHQDFSATFQQGLTGSSFKELESSMNEVIRAYKTVKIQREAQFHLLQSLVSQIQVGILVIADRDEITLFNPTAETLLGIQGTRNWNMVKQLNPDFARTVEELGGNGRKLTELKDGRDTRMVSLDVRTIQLMERPCILITIQDINSEIEQKEIEAWHKLIRILTHEIMNSVTPIASLTETMQGLLASPDGSQRRAGDISEETAADIRFSLETIQKRSEGLLKFVDTYRKLTRVPKPSPERVYLRELFSSVERLMSDSLAQRGILLEYKTEPGLEFVHLDRALIEQVLINLITNSMYALEGRPSPFIQLSAYTNNGSVIIEVSDNGKGIPAKELNEIFVPFFSTRKDGSGIGLSLSKQIVSLHGGTIKVSSQERKGTSFYLRFGDIRA
ncbi:MAG: ATP-binding protein [Bacteroidota bacterium]|nr:MAG: ATP-binding protein [Bacteroidota bacterium]